MHHGIMESLVHKEILQLGVKTKPPKNATQHQREEIRPIYRFLVEEYLVLDRPLYSLYYQQDTSHHQPQLLCLMKLVHHKQH